MIYKIDRASPKIPKSCFVAPSAAVIGDVEIGENSSVWFGAVIRADEGNIRIGKSTNVQDLAVLHVDSKHNLEIGSFVTLGHRVIAHGCKIDDHALIGMGSIIMNDAKIGSQSIVAAGAVVTEGTIIPPRSLAMGVPAKVKRELTEEEIAMIDAAANIYTENAGRYLKELKCS